MANPSSRWDLVPVWGFYFKGDDVTPDAGRLRLTMTSRVTRTDGRRIYSQGATIERTIGDHAADAVTRDRVRAAWLAADKLTQGAAFSQAAWDEWWTTSLKGSVFAAFPAADDPDIIERGYQVKVEEVLASGAGKVHYLQPLLAHLDLTPPGINLATVFVPEGSPLAPAPVYAKGLAGGVAALDADGDVVDAEGTKVLAGGTGGTGTGGVTLTQVNNAVAAHAADETPHPAYDDLPSLVTIFENRLV